MSYSFYLLNLPVLFVFIALAARFPEWLPPVRPTNYILMVLAIAATFAVAPVMYYLIEVPGIALGRRLTRKSTAQAAVPTGLASEQIGPR